MWNLKYGKENLKERQANILKKFDDSSVFIELKKRNVTLDDLAAFTAVNKVEFALFTKGKNVILVKGRSGSCDIPAHLLERLLNEKWIFTGHSHPTTVNLKPSNADKIVLKLFTWQKESSIIDLTGNITKYTSNEQDWYNDLLGVK